MITPHNPSAARSGGDTGPLIALRLSRLASDPRSLREEASLLHAMAIGGLVMFKNWQVSEMG